MSTDDMPYDKVKAVLENPSNYTKEERLQAARQAIKILDSIAHVYHIPPHKKGDDNEEHGQL